MRHDIMPPLLFFLGSNLELLQTASGPDATQNPARQTRTCQQPSAGVDQTPNPLPSSHITTDGPNLPWGGYNNEAPVTRASGCPARSKVVHSARPIIVTTKQLLT